MSQTRLRLIVIRTADMSRAVQFYSSLSIALVEEKHGTGPVHFAAELGEVVLEIYPSKTLTEADIRTRIGFEVGDLPATVDRLKTQNVEIVQEPEQSPWGLRAVVKDPDGRSVELYQSEVESASNEDVA